MPWGHLSLWVGRAHPSPDGEKRKKISRKSLTDGVRCDILKNCEYRLAQ